MPGTLPDLLEALGEVFLTPGACPEPALRAVREADWAGEGLRGSLGRMLEASTGDLPVAFAGLFLAGRPTLPLEVSAYRTGLLRDPEVLAGLEPLYEASGVLPLEGISPDHVGALLVLQARFLRLMGTGQEDLEPCARALQEETLGPLAQTLSQVLAAPGTPPFYAAAGQALAEAAHACSALLG